MYDRVTRGRGEEKSRASLVSRACVLYLQSSVNGGDVEWTVQRKLEVCSLVVDRDGCNISALICTGIERLGAMGGRESPERMLALSPCLAVDHTC